MKHLLISLYLFITIHSSMGQVFQKKLVWKSDSLTEINTNWVDLNNDSLLDILIVAKGANNKLKIKVLKNTLANFTPITSNEVDVTLNSYSLADINGDNKTDITINGFTNGKNLTYSLKNLGNFQFERTLTYLPELAITELKRADFDKDGIPDLVVGGKGFLKLFRGLSTGFELKFDSTGIDINSISIQDFNKDGKLDLIVSASKNNIPILFRMNGKGAFNFENLFIKKPIYGSIELGDFNHDGYFDIMTSGVSSSQKEQVSYHQNKGNWKLVDSLQQLKAGQLLFADSNSDGIAELSYLGKNTNGKKVNFLRDTTGLFTQLDTTNLILQHWGDYDRDGDLDLLQVKDSSTYKVFQILENKTVAKNQRPQKNGINFSVTVFNKTIIYWDTAKDDHTSKKVISYDMLLSKVSDPSKILVSPQFDKGNVQRLSPSHGNQGTNNFAFISNLNEPYNYVVQPVDNSFTGALKEHCYKGVCMGASCGKGTIKNIQACKDTNTTITSPDPVYWFSFKRGFLGLSTSQTVKATEPDTLVSVVIKSGCPIPTVHIVEINSKVTAETQTKFVCIDKPFQLIIKSGWQKVEWKWEQSTSSKDTIKIKTGKDLVVNVKASTGSCSYEKTINLHLSKPKLVLTDNNFKIKKGESVTLQASGAKTYNWNPPTGLSSPIVPNPTATPLASIIYQLIAADSIGCEVKDSVTIVVEETSFIPTLFTPNGDGKNDELKLFGLSAGNNFTFEIYNREGSIVYESTDIQLATSVGWNGSTRGIPQPAGIYYWKIEGTQPNGMPLTLNGKTKGSVLLVR